MTEARLRRQSCLCICLKICLFLIKHFNISFIHTNNEEKIFINEYHVRILIIGVNKRYVKVFDKKQACILGDMYTLPAKSRRSRGPLDGKSTSTTSWVIMSSCTMQINYMYATIRLRNNSLHHNTSSWRRD